MRGGYELLRGKSFTQTTHSTVHSKRVLTIRIWDTQFLKRAKAYALLSELINLFSSHRGKHGSGKIYSLKLLTLLLFLHKRKKRARTCPAHACPTKAKHKINSIISTIMKKFIAFAFCLCALCTAGSAQSLETRTLSLGDNCYYEVIVPTLSNLIAIVNMDVSTFKSTMSRYKYHPDEQFSGSSYVYTNSNLDFYLDDNNGRGVNTIIYDPSGANKFAGFWVLSENAYPRDCIADLYQQLSPYYQKSAGGKRYYALRHNGHSYGIDVSPTQNYKSTVVHIYKFNK